jgi:hypothetical protein
MDAAGAAHCGRAKAAALGGCAVRTGRRRRPCQPAWRGEQLGTASWRGIGMSGDGDGLVMVVSCCLLELRSGESANAN